MKKWSIFGIVFLVVAFIAVIIGLTQTKPIISKSVDFKLNILPKPDFMLAVSPLEIHTPIQRTVAFTAEVTSTQGFVGDVTFSVTNLPVGVTVAILPSDTLTLGIDQTKGVQLEFTIPDDDTLIGWHTLTVTASSDIYN